MLLVETGKMETVSDLPVENSRGEVLCNHIVRIRFNR